MTYLPWADLKAVSQSCGQLCVSWMWHYQTLGFRKWKMKGRCRSGPDNLMIASQLLEHTHMWVNLQPQIKFKSSYSQKSMSSTGVLDCTSWLRISQVFMVFGVKWSYFFQRWTNIDSLQQHTQGYIGQLIKASVTGTFNLLNITKTASKISFLCRFEVKNLAVSNCN